MVRGGSIVIAAAAWLAGIAGQASAQNVDPPRPKRTAAGNDGLLNNEVDDLLQRWHEKTSKVNQLFARFRRTVFDIAFKKSRENEGAARFREPNLARMDISVNEKGDGREIFILSEQPRPRGGKGLELRHYIVKEKRLEIHEFPSDVIHDAQQEGPLRLLFGIKPESAHARYSFQILEKTQAATTVRVIPKLEGDRQEFLEATLELSNKTFMPRALRVKENADTQVTYAFTQIVTNVDDPTLEVLVTDFNPPKINERDWQVTREEHNRSDMKAAANNRPSNRK